VSYDEAAPPEWIKGPWCKGVKDYLDKWQPLTPKERLALIEPMWEMVMSAPECVAYHSKFRDTMTSKLYELSAAAREFGVSLVPLQRRVFHWLKELKKMDCYRATPKYVSKVPMGIPVVMGIPLQAPAEVVVAPVQAPAVVPEVVVAPVQAPAVVAEVMVAPAVVAEVVAPAVVAEVVVAPAVVAEVVVAPPPAQAPSMAEEIAAMVLHKVGALERELADRKRAHEEDMATLLALITEKDARISELEGRLRKVAAALV